MKMFHPYVDFLCIFVVSPDGKVRCRSTLSFEPMFRICWDTQRSQYTRTVYIYIYIVNALVSIQPHTHTHTQQQ